jgi:hypothetical protein
MGNVLACCGLRDPPPTATATAGAKGGSGSGGGTAGPDPLEEKRAKLSSEQQATLKKWVWQWLIAVKMSLIGALLAEFEKMWQWLGGSG